MILDYFKLALRNLTRRKLRSWLTMLGIIIGITAVVSLIGMGEGLKVAITSQFGDLGTDKITVQASGGFGPPGTGVVKPLTTRNLDKLAKVNGVKVATGRLVRAGKLEFNDIAGFGFAVSMPDGDGRKLVETAFNIEAADGRLLRDGESGLLMMGNVFGENKAGFQKAMKAGDTVLLNDKKYTVAGILESQGNFIMDSAVFINEDDARELLEIPKDELDVIVVQINQDADSAVVSASIEKVMRKERDVRVGEEDFAVQTPEQVLEQVGSTLFAVQLFVYIIAGISIVVGGIGIMNTMFTSVIERTRDIGIMKSIGARNSAIFYLFFIESGLLGSVGGSLGAIFGVLLATLLSLAGRAALGVDLIQAHISPWLIIGSIGGSFLLGSLFGIIPAINASRLHPVDALRHKK